MKDFIKPLLEIILMAVGIYAVMLGLYWFIIA